MLCILVLFYSIFLLSELDWPGEYEFNYQERTFQVKTISLTLFYANLQITSKLSYFFSLYFHILVMSQILIISLSERKFWNTERNSFLKYILLYLYLELLGMSFGNDIFCHYKWLCINTRYTVKKTVTFTIMERVFWF